MRWLDDLLVSSGSGSWLKPSVPEVSRGQAGTVVLYGGDLLGGTPGSASVACEDDDDARLKLLSTDYGDLFGWSVSAIGDISGDGHDDFIVGAPRGPFGSLPSGAPAPWVGRVYVFTSQDYLAWIDHENTPGLDPDWTGGTAGCKPGCATCDNSLTGDPLKREPGDCTYPGYFSATIRAAAVLQPSPLGGGSEKAYFGWSLSRAGDFDGDGTEDFVIGAPGSDNRTLDPFGPAGELGRAYIVSGQKLATALAGGSGQMQLVVGDGTVMHGVTTDDLLVEGLTVAEADFGSQPGDRLGHSVSYSDDVNGDSKPDVILGAPQYRWIRWKTGIKGYSVQCNGPGKAYVVAGGAPVSPINQHDVQNFTGNWYLTAADYLSTTPGSPNYGEAFGFCVTGRVGSSHTPGGGDPWDMAVGAPLWSQTPAGVITFDPVPSNPLVPELDFPDWHALGTQAEGLMGWTVRAVGNVDGFPGQEIAIGTRSFNDFTTAPTDICASPCFQELSPPFAGLCPTGAGECSQVVIGFLDDDAGGESCGRVTVHQAVNGIIRFEIRGEDLRDSVGWGIARLDTNTVDGAARLVVAAPRWAGDNQSRRINTGSGVQDFNSVDENGRVYVFESEALGGTSQ